MKKIDPKWGAFIAIAFGPLMATLDSSSVNVSLPIIARELHASMSDIEWVVTSYLLAIGAFLLPLGRLGDQWNKKKLFRIGLIAFTLSSLLCPFSQTVFQLIFFRVLQGMGGAIFMSIAPALLVSSFPSSERGRAVGMMGMTVSTGLMLGAPVGGLLTDYISWKAIFLINLPIGVLGFFLAEKFLQEETHCTEEFRFLDFSLFKNRFFVGGNLSLLSYFIALFILYFLTPFYLSDVLEYSPKKVGFVMMTFSLAFAVVPPISGWLSDKVGSQILSPMGLALAVVAYLCASQLTAASTPKEVVLTLLFVGVAAGLFQAPNNSAILGAVKKSQLGVASALIATMRTFGTMLGVAIGTVFFTFFIQKASGVGGHFNVHELSPELFIQGFKPTLWVAAAFALIGFCFSLMRGDTKRHHLVSNV